MKVTSLHFRSARGALALALTLLLLFTACADKGAGKPASAAPASAAPSSAASGPSYAAISGEPQAIPLVSVPDFEPVPAQVEELSRTEAEPTRVYSFAPDGRIVNALTWNEYGYYDPQLSQNKTGLLMRVNAPGWSARMLTDLALGQQRYCGAEPRGNKRMEWVGNDIIACTIEPRHNAVDHQELFFFDRSYRLIEDPFALSTLDGNIFITGIWIDEQTCSFIYTAGLGESPENIAVGTPHLRVVAREGGALLSDVALEGYLSPASSWMGFGAPLYPAAVGGFLTRLIPADTADTTEWSNAQWTLVSPTEGVLYSIPDSASLRAFDGVRLCYSPAPSEENDWAPQGTLCTLGERAPENVRSLDISKLTPANDGLRSYTIGDPLSPLWGAAGSFSGDTLWLFANADCDDTGAQPRYAALLTVDLWEGVPSVVARLPLGARLAGTDANGNALVLVGEASDNQDYRRVVEKDIPMGVEFWNTRGQLLAASGLTACCITPNGAGTLDRATTITAKELYNALNRVYAYLFWQNGQQGSSYTLSPELLSARLTLLFGDDALLPLLKEYLGADGSLTLTMLSPDPSWADGWGNFADYSLNDLYDWGDGQGCYLADLRNGRTLRFILDAQDPNARLLEIWDW